MKSIACIIFEKVVNRYIDTIHEDIRKIRKAICHKNHYGRYEMNDWVVTYLDGTSLGVVKEENDMYKLVWFVRGTKRIHRCLSFRNGKPESIFTYE